jgi:hypothetical protein
MMNDLDRIRQLVRKCKDVPPGEIIRRAFNKIKRNFGERIEQWRDNSKQTYSNFQGINRLNQYVKPLPRERLKPHAEIIAALAKKYLDHKFDLLGSGWTKVYHGMNCPGVEGHRYTSIKSNDNKSNGGRPNGTINSANTQFAEQVWSHIEDDYVPIDWQLDFKSGFRWSESTWYKHITYGNADGADVKVPWELARMQHLPQLAFAFALAKITQNQFDKPIGYLTEYVNQVLDFIAHNPPRYGVNWNCTMDVAIRVVNWLIAYDIFKAHGARFNRKFKRYFFSSIYDHGKHIAGNLEYSTELRGNHYLSNIAGLLFVSVYLPATFETNTWMAFSIKEFNYEIDTQFNKDGSNFEASTSYHRLSTEILIYCAAILRGIPENRLKQALKIIDKGGLKIFKTIERFPIGMNDQNFEKKIKKIIQVAEERILSAVKFSMDMTGPLHQSVQIGDNDNGRFLKLQPALQTIKKIARKKQFLNLTNEGRAFKCENYLFESSLDHRHLISAANGLLSNSELRKDADDNYYEECIVSGIANKKNDTFQMDGIKNKTSLINEQVDGLLLNIKKKAYPDFGVFLYRSDNLFLVIRCGSLGQNGFGGHAHNDQLSIVLAIKNHFLFIDPGSYTYTNLPKKRNEFRSTQMHNTLACYDLEQNDFMSNTLFALNEKTFSRVLSFEDTMFSAEHNGYGTQCKRTINIENMGLRIVDSCRKKNTFLNLHVHENVHTSIANDKQNVSFIIGNERISMSCNNALITKREGVYSDSYGWIRKNEKLKISCSDRTINWYLRLERR